MKSIITQLDEQTWQIKEFDEQNSVYMYLLAGNQQAVLIDSGFGLIELDAIVRELTTLPIQVFLTHGHIDHIGGTGFFENVHLHADDRQVYELHCKRYSALVPGRTLRPHKHDLHTLTNNQRFNLGGRTLTIIHTPGHSIGSICVLDVERKWMFTGDTCCKADVLLNLEGSATIETYLATMKMLGTYKDRIQTTWPAHHSVPVATDIFEQFEHCASVVSANMSSGAPIDTAFGPARRLPYKDIAVVY